ncbi:vanadium-dependent haloperoxidase [Pseudalkalibacillus hwajinpoensis]|uniref:Phosphatase PAP2 family protein n=1 Tax=Guptibacillus hwajinpoensis TaxID=208199 RepID=A0A4U1MEY5_9BACL|nr:vanadium-dependent haloperoxidase [Pseudalkalibacillus hwajinpoensis]TKD69261.1 phosphatase PAP2 family protein [Pseudalkalibacillus hwajinpoensis]
MTDRYEKWSELPYAGESKPPHNPEEPYAGSWPNYYIRNKPLGRFETLNGRPIRLAIKHPSTIDWDAEQEKVVETLKHITPHQVTLAEYWGTGVASKQWTPIIDKLIDNYGVTAARAARIIACVSAGMNDAFTTAWYLKYRWDVARPNQLDHELATIVCTPRHPTYPSGHATVAGVTAEILSYFFPTERKRLFELAEECSDSRLYGGVHFPIDNSEGLRLGKQIGSIVVSEISREENSRGQMIDTPYREERHVKLTPPPYKQVIDHKFENKCSSKIEHPICKNNALLSKPKLFYK